MTAAEEQKELAIQSEMGTCAHFRGIHRGCAAGVDMRGLVGGPDFGWAMRIPCLIRDTGKCEVTCEKRKLPTREEAEAEIKRQEEQFAKVTNCMGEAKRHAKAAGLGRGRGGNGELPCPSGCGGTLHYSVAAVNGRMHAACSTKGCVSWME